jgi:heptaprenyl diphosphate synthase
VAHYLAVLADKTASLIATSARFGALLAGADRAVVETVAAFGERIGVAFQLADDVLDLTSDGAVSGKTPGTDLLEGVPTMPVLLLRARAAGPDATEADRALVAALDGDLSDEGALHDVVAALRDHDVVRETRAMAAEHVAAAVRALDALPLPAGPVRRALLDFADALVDRAS